MVGRKCCRRRCRRLIRGGIGSGGWGGGRGMEGRERWCCWGGGRGGRGEAEAWAGRARSLWIRGWRGRCFSGVNWGEEPGRGFCITPFLLLPFLVRVFLLSYPPASLATRPSLFYLSTFSFFLPFLPFPHSRLDPAEQKRTHGAIDFSVSWTRTAPLPQRGSGVF